MQISKQKTFILHQNSICSLQYVYLFFQIKNVGIFFVKTCRRITIYLINGLLIHPIPNKQKPANGSTHRQQLAEH